MGATAGISGIAVAAPFLRWASGDTLRASARIPHAQWLDPNEVMRARMVVHVVFGGDGGGVEFRFSSVGFRSARPAGVGGADVSPRAGLIDEPPVAQAYKLGDGVSSARALTFSFPAEFVDARRLIAEGILLHGIAEVALEIPTLNGAAGSYDRRFVLVRGVVDGVKFGGVFPAPTGASRIRAGSEIAEVVVADPRDLVSSFIPPWIVDATRWSTVHATSVGLRVPLVINGFPGIPAVRVTSTGTGSNRFVFAAGAGWSVASASGVIVNGVVKGSGDATYGWTLSSALDALGLEVSQITFTNGATVWSDSDAVHVIATLASGNTSSIVDVIRTLCRDVAPFGEQGLNGRMFAEAAARLPGTLGHPSVLINAASGGSASGAIDVIENGLCASYPMISMAWEDGAYGPILTDFRVPSTARLIAGAFPLFDRSVLVQASPTSEVFNGFILRYAYDPILDTFAKVAFRNAENSGICAYSRTLVGPRDLDPIESVYITDEGTAEYVIDWLVAHRALPSYLVEYEAHPVAFLTLRRGDPVTITDTDFGWSDTPATVEAVEYRSGYASVTLRVWSRALDVGGAALSVPKGG